MGSSAPVLARLAKASFIKCTGTGPRKSRRFSITEAGEKALDTNWQSLLDARPTDFEAFRWLRTLCEAARLDAQSEALKQAAEQITNKKNKR